VTDPTVPVETGSAGILTFLFSDIEGSTRLEQALGSTRYGELRERHRALLRAAFAAHDGHEEGTEGDSFFVSFPTAAGAIAAAAAAQRAIAGEPWPEDGAIRVRMGIHSGEARLLGGSLVGLDINRAARIAGVAHGGQALVSEATRVLAGSALPDGLGFRDLGAHRLKDLRDPARIHQLEIPGLRADFPPLRSLDAHPNNLPTQLTSFVGRETELAEARALLAANRLVTLTGPGGTGKTRLSLQVAASAADDFPDGLFFVALETVRDPELVASRIAGAIGLAETSRPARDMLVEWLGSRKVLFVLDNFEQVLGAGPIVTDLLRAAPGLKAMVTSRAALHVSGEQEYPVPGLPTPPDLSHLSAIERAQLPAEIRTPDPERLSTYEAVRLFIARASAVRPGFSVTNENAPAVAAISARLHGMPLAIELAAARVKLLSPDAILARLEDQLGVLAAGSRDLPMRQQTLRGAIAWSYDLLDEPLRRLLDRLSVFQGGFDLEAAEGVCGPAGEVGGDILDGLTSLADQSLIKVVDGPDVRFVMLETIREFAGEMLDSRGECDAVRTHHTDWFLALAERAAPELPGSDQRRWLERLETEHDNLRAALDRSVGAGDADRAIRLAFALWRFWQKRGHLAEARRRLDAIEAEPWSHATPVLRARLVEALGGICWWQADILAMRPRYEEAVAIWRELGDRAELANALYNLAFIYTVAPTPGVSMATVDPAGEGRRILAEALGIFQALGDRRGEANVLWALGNYDYFRDQGEVGEPQFRAALALFREVGDRTMEAWSLHMLGGAQVRRGELDESRDNLRHALRHFHEASDAAGITLVFDDLASQAVAEGDLERAARLWGAARNLTAATGTTLASYVDEAHEAYMRPHLQQRMDPAERDRLAREGAAMSLDEAVAYALGTTVEELRPHVEAPA
jgi:predicted ATPase/class 3 adenylate cyclase